MSISLKKSMVHLCDIDVDGRYSDWSVDTILKLVYKLRVTISEDHKG